MSGASQPAEREAATSSARQVSLAAALLVFGVALALRLVFFSGFVLGDDAEEFLLVKHIWRYGLDFQVHRHLEYRFPMWLFNVASFHGLGATETAFFLPTLILSSSLGPIGYLILRLLGYGIGWALLGSLFVATAPFEVLLGTLRANDLILAWFLALALLSFVALRHRVVLQGAALATLLWLGFYTKLWALYVLPALGLYYLARLVRRGEWRGPLSFGLVSLALHGLAASLWKRGMGSWLPFLSEYSATYPVAPADLMPVLGIYPKLMFVGSQFGTTLFGAVPLVLIVLLAVAAFLRLRGGREAGILDATDGALLLYYVSFFLLIEFFPNNFQFDRYYSVPRVFRYLAPLSFPMTLHAAKLLLDLGRTRRAGPRLPPGILVAIFCALFALNVVQAAEATRPGRAYREAFVPILAEIERDCPPKLLVEARLAIVLNNVYFETSCPGMPTAPFLVDRPAAEYEAWLEDNASQLPEGAMLITGLASYVHYGCPGCGFRLAQFADPLEEGWKLVGEYAEQDYLPVPEPARLWRLAR